MSMTRDEAIKWFVDTATLLGGCLSPTPPRYVELLAEAKAALAEPVLTADEIARALEIRIAWATAVYSGKRDLSGLDLVRLAALKIRDGSIREWLPKENRDAK